jgi:selenide,water dikinase
MADGSRRAADVVVLTTGLVPPRLIERSGLPHDEHGALTVRGDLKVPGLPIFGGGDCISVAGADVMRVGVHAIRQGPILWRNIRSVLGDAGAQPSARYEPEQKPLLILNLGDGTGLATWRGRARRNRLWMAIKERIDWQFVRTTGKEVRIGLQAPPRPGDDRVETPKPMRGREK